MPHEVQVKDSGPAAAAASSRPRSRHEWTRYRFSCARKIYSEAYCCLSCGDLQRYIAMDVIRLGSTDGALVCAGNLFRNNGFVTLDMAAR